VTGLAKCLNCGTRFDVSAVRAEYEEYGEEYGEGDHNDDLCADCAMPGLESTVNAGRAILMMNGDEDYDDDFVQKWL
jgi:hypothetical protein